ncbi:hypothetical protein OHB01_17970 [Microbispora hainanensis]|uniref:hypothetical protein n=1 Tax=Microbispora hainanensis TaxID=568844 RepID=UPI002E2B8A25|nr:hypothetical protein [Microbispora hainanensis]
MIFPICRPAPHEGFAAMPAVAGVAVPLPEVARLVAHAIDSSGHPASTIAKSSIDTAKDFSEMDPSLKGSHFDSSFLSRVRNDKIRKPNRGKLIVLKLTLLRLDDPGHLSWSHEQRSAALGKAVEFAKQVSAAVAEARVGSGSRIHNGTSARHARTVELFGAQGEFLLHELEDSSTGEAEAKLAVLHKLSGDGDDARYWTILAATANPDYAPPSSQHELFNEARRYAAEYHRARDVEAARMYLRHAADFGDAISAFQLGQMAELEGDARVAINWYRKADELGHPHGEQSAKRLSRQTDTHEDA